MKAPAAILNGKTTLETLIGLLAESSLMITNDSGPMHIAAALGAPAVAVLGSTDEGIPGTFGPRTRIVKYQVECSPCLLRDCPIDHRCMNGVTVENVCIAARELIGNCRGGLRPSGLFSWTATEPCRKKSGICITPAC